MRPKPLLALPTLLALLTLLALVSLMATGCATSRRATDGRRGFEQSGIASWYGPGFHGRTTANGETYDMEAMTAAHKELPFGSIVEVRNRDNGRSTRVRINDRGPFVRGRIIDLSKAAARKIDMLGSGVARVRIRVVGESSHAERQYRSNASRVSEPASEQVSAGTYTLQAGSFRDLGRAKARLSAVRTHYRAARIDSSSRFHRVVINHLTKPTAEAAVSKLGRQGIEAILVPTRR